MIESYPHCDGRPRHYWSCPECGKLGRRNVVGRDTVQRQWARHLTNGHASA